jgi:hypothetical protein
MWAGCDTNRHPSTKISGGNIMKTVTTLLGAAALAAAFAAP